MEHTAPLEDATGVDGRVAPRPATTPGVRETGGVRFGPGASGRPDAAGEGSLLAVTVNAVSATARGRLAERIDDAIERELDRMRAGPPGVGAARDADANLSDQLFRARQVGATGVALSLPPLAAIAGRCRALGAEDSETLLFWARATRERPVTLCLDASDAALSAHVDPIPLRLALDPSRTPASPLRIPGAATIGLSVTEVVEVSVAPPPPHDGAPETEPETAVLVAEALRQPPRPEPPPPAIDDSWRTLTLALTAARGPQPLAAFERLFADSYLPLDTLLRDPARVPDPRAVHARDEFKDNFTRVYLEAERAFATTGKRPKMVLDAPDLAARIGRQNSARTSQILLIDGMRYDLGQLVKVELARLLAHKAVLTNELVLWSALPTTTTHQLTTLAKGVAALADEAEEEREDGALRGRTATTIRRVKIGSRDLYRLDLSDVRVREAGDRVLPLLPQIAADVAETIAKHASLLGPRTLLFVFGDHGFTLARDGAPSSGGASPEEVLVPAFAFLLGASH
jgi:hypothetical protein